MQLKENRQIKQMYSSKFLLSNIMQIYWGVTNNCNLNCHYCSKYKTEEFYSLDCVNSIVEFINNLSKMKSMVFLKLFGGEPTIHPNILDIIRNINSKINTELQTNLMLDTTLLNEIINVKNISTYNISLHYGLTDRSVFFNNLNLLLKYSSKYKYNILLNLMYEKDYHELIDKDYRVYNRISKAFYDNFSVGISLVYHNIKNEYDETVVQWANNTYKKFKQSDRYITVVFEDGTIEQNSFYYIKGMEYNGCKGMKCSCLKNNIYVDSNGDVYPCQTYFRYLNQKYGNILQDKNILLDKLISEEYVVCEAEKCDCELDIPKWR